MKSDYDRLVFPILIGKRQGGDLKQVKKVGRCILDRGNEFYRLKLLMFPRETYYIEKSPYNDCTFKVHSKMFFSRGKAGFVDQIGSGLLENSLKRYMRLSLNLVPFTLYMDLYPCNVN